jgi:hypothetical protein
VTANRSAGPSVVTFKEEEKMGKHLRRWAIVAILVSLAGGCKTSSTPC